MRLTCEKCQSWKRHQSPHSARVSHQVKSSTSGSFRLMTTPLALMTTATSGPTVQTGCHTSSTRCLQRLANMCDLSRRRQITLGSKKYLTDPCCNSFGQAEGPAYVFNDLPHKNVDALPQQEEQERRRLDGQKKGSQHVQMVVDARGCTVCFHTRDARGSPRHLRCVTAVAAASVYGPEGVRPTAIRILDTMYGDGSDDDNDHDNDGATDDDNDDGNDGSGPTYIVDAAAGAAPLPVPGQAEEHWTSQYDGQKQESIGVEWEAVEVGGPAQVIERTDKLPPDARRSNNESIKLYRLYVLGASYSVAWERATAVDG